MVKEYKMKPIEALKADKTVRLCEFCLRRTELGNKISHSAAVFICCAPGANQDERIYVDQPCTYADSQICVVFSILVKKNEKH